MQVVHVDYTTVTVTATSPVFWTRLLTIFHSNLIITSLIIKFCQTIHAKPYTPYISRFDKKNIEITVSGSTVTHLWHFGCRPAHHFLLPDFLLDEDTGHVEGAQQRVGLEPQSVALGRQQLQGV